MMEDKFHDECAVIGVVGVPEASKLCYLGLYAMQHRGQEGAGIVSFDGQEPLVHKAIGLVADGFSSDVLSRLRGKSAIGHARYATSGSKDSSNLQPLLARVSTDSYAIAHNGNLVNFRDVRKTLEEDGAIFAANADSEVILHLLARSTKPEFEERLVDALTAVTGAYSLVLMYSGRLFAVRDPHGVRPLSIGKVKSGYVAASETCAFDLIEAKFVRDVEPGEIVELTSEGIRSIACLPRAEHAACVFEKIYFLRPDSEIEGEAIYELRKRLGSVLANESNVKADVVVPVPDSGTPAAKGFADESGIRFEFGLMRNHYVGRTFIEPQQSIRDFGVKIKLNPVRSTIEGKRVVLVDDSLVRGTTSKKIVSMVRSAGAKEVHVRISSPPTIKPCHYGIDTPSEEELIASSRSNEEIRSYIGADSLEYLTLEGMYKAVRGKREKHCDACFSGLYKLGTP